MLTPKITIELDKNGMAQGVMIGDYRLPMCRGVEFKNCYGEPSHVVIDLLVLGGVGFVTKEDTPNG